MSTSRKTIEIRPQAGPQEEFLATSADIGIFGGAAGCGKTWVLLLEPLRHIHNKNFGAVIFRRTSPQIRNEGGLWDESGKLYQPLGAAPKESMLEWDFPLGSRVKFAHLQYEKDKYDWQGSQIPLIGFDELTHFSRTQFFYLLSRNRSMCGVRPYVRATCNPDADSWVAEFIGWWIDQDTGYPIPERSGKVRWFIVLSGVIIWADSKEQLIADYGDAALADDHEEQVSPKSVTFVAGKITDNPALMKADPGYLANLRALPNVEQQRLLGGNWKIRPAAGLYFNRAWCEIVDAVPTAVKRVRYWDLASTEKTDENDPDWTVGVKMSQDAAGVYYVEHVARMRVGPLKVYQAIRNTASQDTPAVRIGLPQDPGQAGKSQAAAFVRNLAGYTVTTKIESGDKVVRFGPFSSQAQAGNVKILRGAWNEDYFTSLEAFPPEVVGHDDDADASSGAMEMITVKVAGHVQRKITGT